MIRMLLLLGVVVGLGCASTGGSSDAEPTGELLALVFDWPDGLRAEVAMERSEERMAPDGSAIQSQRRNLRYVMNVEAVPDGRLIRYDDIRIEDPTTGRWSEPVQMNGPMPSFVVDADGAFLRLQDIDALMAEVEREVAPMIDRLPEGGEARTMARSLVSEEVIAARTSNDWDPVVGSWVGAELEVGALYEGEDVGTVPLFGGMDIPLAFEVGIVEWVDCDGENLLPRCVEIQYLSRPDPEKSRTLFSGIFTRFAKPGEPLPDVEEFVLEQRVQLITQPESLIPHYLQVEKEFRFTLSLPDGTRQSAGQRESSIHRFRYPR